MSWLIDTNVISEIRKGARGHPAVAAWWAGVRDEELFLSALTLGEIRKGIETIRPREPARALALEAWLREVVQAFGPRILPMDSAAADIWGRLSSQRSVPVVDAMLAATASLHGLVLVTRNVKDVAGLGVAVLDPFAA